jgi:hypothetical protein
MLTYAQDDAGDRRIHRKRHEEMAKGSMPQQVRDFSKAFGWAVAHNDGGLESLKNIYKPELGKLVVAYSWWSRARTNGAEERDFDAFMNAHLAFSDALVTGEGIEEASSAIKKWERFAG